MLSAPIRRDVPTFATLCAIVGYVLQADPSLGLAGADPLDLEDAVKVACARNHLLYTSTSVGRAVEAVQHVRRRGR